MKQLRRHQEHGFTIIELMIATAVFATVLVLCTVGLLQVGRFYYKGITSSRTQEATRTIIEDITESIQFSGGDVYAINPPAGDSVTKGYCVGSKRYSYVLGRQLVTNQRVLVLDTDIDSCSPVTPALSLAGNPANIHDGRELVNTRMRLAAVHVKQLSVTDDSLYKVLVRVVSGDDDLLEDRLRLDAATDQMVPGTDGVLDTCRAQRSGSQFCAVSELSTVVQKRVR